LVTDGPLDGYLMSLKGRQVKESDRCLEIGPGLGEFIPHLVQNHQFHERPTVIDIADYNRMKMMLEYVSTLGNVNIGLRQKLRTLAQRCDTYLDPSKVNLVNKSLVDALEEHPEYQGLFDIVVDLDGAYLYGKMKSSGSDVREIEKSLVATGGILIPTEPGESFGI